MSSDTTVMARKVQDPDTVSPATSAAGGVDPVTALAARKMATDVRNDSKGATPLTVSAAALRADDPRSQALSQLQNFHDKWNEYIYITRPRSLIEKIMDTNYQEVDDEKLLCNAIEALRSNPPDSIGSIHRLVSAVLGCVEKILKIPADKTKVSKKITLLEGLQRLTELESQMSNLNEPLGIDEIIFRATQILCYEVKGFQRMQKALYYLQENSKTALQDSGQDSAIVHRVVTRYRDQLHKAIQNYIHPATDYDPAADDEVRKGGYEVKGQAKEASPTGAADKTTSQTSPSPLVITLAVVIVGIVAFYGLPTLQTLAIQFKATIAPTKEG